MRIFALALLLSGPLLAEGLSGFAGLDLSDNSQIGYARPTVTALAGVEYRAPWWEASLTGFYSRARKQELSSGWDAGVTVTGLAKPCGPLLAGGCWAYGYTHSPTWGKDAARPCLALGSEWPLTPTGRLRMLVRHWFRGTDAVNGSQDDDIAFRLAWLHEHGETRLGVHFTRLAFWASNNPDRAYTRGAYGLSLTEAF